MLREYCDNLLSHKLVLWTLTFSDEEKGGGNRDWENAKLMQFLLLSPFLKGLTLQWLKDWSAGLNNQPTKICNLSDLAICNPYLKNLKNICAIWYFSVSVIKKKKTNYKTYQSSNSINKQAHCNSPPLMFQPFEPPCSKSHQSSIDRESNKATRIIPAALSESLNCAE